METKKFIITSLNFSPGLEKEIKLLAKLISSLPEHYVSFRVSKHYKRIKNEGRILDLLFENIIIYNVSLWFIPIILFRQFFCRTTRSYLCVHEPGKLNKKDFNWFVRIELYIKEFLTSIIVRNSDKIITFSDYGTSVFIKKYPIKRDIIQLSLFREKITTDFSCRSKSILFTGQVNSTKYPKNFFNLANSGKFNDFNFTLLTSAKIPASKIPSNVNFINPIYLSDELIQQEMMKSSAVFIEHPCIIQSGVFADCIATGTPVIYFGQEGIEQYADESYSFDMSKHSFKDLHNWITGLESSKAYDCIDKLYHKEFSKSAFLKKWKPTI